MSADNPVTTALAGFLSLLSQELIELRVVPELPVLASFPPALFSRVSAAHDQVEAAVRQAPT